MIPLPLEAAKIIAKTIVTRLQGQVQRVEIAGSVRRERPEVNNIDFVIIPKPNVPFIYSGEALVPTAKGNFQPTKAWRFAEFMCRPSELSEAGLGIMETFANPNDKTIPGVCFQVHTATEANFGSVLLYRTGNANFNKFIATRAFNHGLYWARFGEPQLGLINTSNKVAASKTEEEIFDALGMKFVPPTERERAKGAVRARG